MTTQTSKPRKPQTPPADQSESVTITVTPPHAVFFDGEQRTGTIACVPRELAAQWLRNGWASTLSGRE